MPEYQTVTENVRRRTYLTGRFDGKFVGYFDYVKSDRTHENFYDIEIISGRLVVDRKNIRHWNRGEHEVFGEVGLSATKFPPAIHCLLRESRGEEREFALYLHDVKIKNIRLTKQLHEGEELFADIDCELSGYFEHYDQVETQVEVIASDPEIPPVLVEPDAKAVKPTDIRTGKVETASGSIREEVKNTDGVSTSKTPWVQKPKSVDQGSWRWLMRLLQIVLFVLFIIALLVYGVEAIIPAIVFLILYYIVSVFSPVIAVLWRWLVPLLCLLVLLLIGTAVFLASGGATDFYDPSLNDPTIPKPQEVLLITDTLKKNELVTHQLDWTSYAGQQFSMTWKIWSQDADQSTMYRDNLKVDAMGGDQYNTVVSLLHSYDYPVMDSLYGTLDSIRTDNNLSHSAFAEAIVSCVQSIPYVLVLPLECEASAYTDQFVTEYLDSEGSCRSNERFGMLSPAEFVETLAGDCDTRTLFLFTVLRHFGYGVVMLSSDYHRHSIIGVDLPYVGVAKTIMGRRYVLWETTSEGTLPGKVPVQISNPELWEINLISKQNYDR